MITLVDRARDGTLNDLLYFNRCYHGYWCSL